MILSRRLPRTLRSLLARLPRDGGERPRRVAPGQATEPAPRRDADWAIREIVDELMVEPAR